MNSIPDLLSKQAQSQPDAIAIMAPGRLPLTYRGLYAHVTSVVQTLNDCGVGRHDRVAIAAGANGPEMASTFLAVAAAATSAPLNPAYRAKEFDFYLEDLNAKALIIHAELDSPARSVAQARGIPIIDCIPEERAGLFTLVGATPCACPDEPSPTKLGGLAQPDDVALVLHTSGTTSRPKMVPLTHRNICTSAQNIVRTLQLTPQDRCLNVMPLFHIHGLMAATLSSMMAGGSLVCTPGFDGEQFFAWMEAFEPTWYTAVPTMHQAVLAGAASHQQIIARHPLRFIRSSSASLPPKVMAGLEEAFNAPMIESYGMTEASHQMTSNPLPPHKRQPGSVGIAAGPEVAIMDEASPSLLQQGGIGEIVIRGTNVTLGYANNPEANQKAFTNGWFRTGDQGYFDSDGYLFITGRLKEMINRGGEKIAPREVDELLLEHPHVKQAITFAVPHETLGEDVAAAVILKEGATVTERELRQFAFRQLADYKVPTQILLVDEIPKGPTGKLQRIGLAEKLADKLKSDAERVAPSGPIEEALADIWAEVLGKASAQGASKPVGSVDNFFALGGDSLSGALIIGKIQQQWGISLPLTTLLQGATIAELAEAVDAAQQQSDENEQLLHIERDQRFQPFPLTDMQQAYWIGRTGLFQGGKVAHHHYLEIEEIGLQVERLSQAWQQMIERHDMLRAFILPDGQQQVIEDVPPYKITLFDMRQASDETIKAHLLETRQRMSHQVIESSQWPLFDIRASLLPDKRVRLHISFDGLIADAWSRRLLLREWGHFYAKPDMPLPRLEVAFRDYVNGMVALKASPIYQRDRAYWQQRLPTLPSAPNLPQTKAAITAAHFVRQEKEVAPEIWQQLKARGQQAGVSSAALLLTIYSDILAVWSREQHFTINVARFDRQQWHPQMEDIVGQFGSFTLLEVRYRNDEPFIERAHRIQAQLWQDMAHSSFSGVEVLRELGQTHAKIGAITMPIVFTMYATDRRLPDDAHAPSLLDYGEIFSANQTPQVWLDFHVYEIGNALQCDWDAVEEIFPAGLMQSMFEATWRVLHRLATDDESWQEPWTTTAQQIVPMEQLAQREAINSVAMPLPDELLQTAFIQNALQQPEQTAIITPTKTLTYQELYALSNRWARYLRDLGVQPNQLVAVVMEKGWEQLVAVLAILQSGAAYLPIDTGVPPERLAFLLQHSNIELVLTPSWLGQQLILPPGVQQIWVDQETPAAPVSDKPLLVQQSPDDLAVVIYTSGSTGVPKGVMLTHRSLLNSVTYTNQRFGLSQNDSVLALTALHHDMSIFDLFGSLSAGGTIVMPAAQYAKDPAHWLALIEQHQVSLWNSVPAMMEMFLAYTESHTITTPLPLRLTFLGGDWIPLSLPQRLWDIAKNTQIISVGGPTETSLWNIMFPINDVDPTWESIPYGRPIANNDYYILNETLADCPTWVAGELYCAGTGVALGYWRDEASSNEKFLVHPRSGERLCRTGDVGRYLPDGTIEFLGRRDFQVKINGQRIELGEIEATLQRHPAIQRAVVLVQKKQLVAFVVAQDDRVDHLALDSFLRAKLPEYMVPTQLIRLEELPLTANGKIDRRGLAELAKTSTAVIPARPSDTPSDVRAGLERQIAALIASILAVDTIDANANLFYLGVNSIDMVRIGNRIEAQFGVRLRMDQLFRLTSVSAIADFIKGQLPTALAPQLSDYQTLVAAYKPLLTPAEREAFKNSRPGIQQIEEGSHFVQLAKPALNDEQRQDYIQRRSVRLFSLKPIPQERFGQFLRCLSPIQLNDGQLKYRWGSPGGLYPIQTYLHLKAGRVEALQGGIYYYHPTEHRLVLVAADVTLDRNIHASFINTPIFDEAAFSLFLIVEFGAIAPSYGERSLHLSTLEAGSIAHLLETEAPNYGLGLCQIGSIDFERVRPLFQLNDSQQLIHSLLGGGVDPKPTPAEVTADTKAARLLERINQLSEDEAKQLLAAHRR